MSSSNLVSVGYDAASETLEVEFRESRVYQYAGFPQHEYDAFMSASSLGSHFYHHIRDRYVTTEIL
ncbi:KTSC domain-containing protein [Candidatus Poriferisodalis sp.]|uniref:KTSC domain-containing protein n=1 Tax=Candidatus Poriferisodalis sp. TaxID=3101277 RepID=UPI003B025755